MATSKLGFGGPGQRSKYDFENADTATDGRASEIYTYAGSEALPEVSQSTSLHLSKEAPVFVFNFQAVTKTTNSD
jgi:hypothetical protein